MITATTDNFGLEPGWQSHAYSCTYTINREKFPHFETMLKKLRLSRLDVSFSATNLFTISAKELKGQTPTQGGFASIQLSDRPTYTLGLTVSF